MKIAFSLIVIIILSYSTGMLLEVVAEGDESKMLRFFNTGQVEPNWIPFGPVGTMYQSLGIIDSAYLEHYKYPELIGFGYLSDDDDDDDKGPISSANVASDIGYTKINVAFDIEVRKINVEDKKSLQNVVNPCIFHSPKSFSPLCVICTLLDITGEKVLGKGELIELEEDYVESTTKEIEVFSVPVVAPGMLAANDVQDVERVSVEICAPGAVFLIIDEDSIDNGLPPNFFSDTDVNDDIADIGLRIQLPFFAANIGNTITLHTGEMGDEGWFAPKTIPASWDAAGPNFGTFHVILF